jgi:hypothetical protein
MAVAQNNVAGVDNNNLKDHQVLYIMSRDETVGVGVE